LGYVAGAQALQHGPMFMTSGGADTIAVPAQNQQPVFDSVNVPIFWATLANASHLVPMQPDSGSYRPAIIAWFRYQLMGDAQAGRLFQGPACGLCTASDWTVQRKGGA
ncbi:MAG: alpha/beta hydrolase, partial [Alphaproteobacteria bacterium]